MVLLYFKNQFNNETFSIDVSETDTCLKIKSKIIENRPPSAGIVFNPSEISLSYYLPNNNSDGRVPLIDLDDNDIIPEYIINGSEQNPIAYASLRRGRRGAGGGRRRRLRTKRRRTKRRRTKRKGSKKRSRRTRRRR